MKAEEFSRESERASERAKERERVATSARVRENKARPTIGRRCHHGDEPRPIRGHGFLFTNSSLILGLWMGPAYATASLSRYYYEQPSSLDLKRILRYNERVPTFLVRSMDKLKIQTLLSVHEEQRRDRKKVIFPGITKKTTLLSGLRFNLQAEECNSSFEESNSFISIFHSR